MGYEGVRVTHDSQRLMAGALDAVTAPVCVLDGSGIIVAVNQAWRDFSASNGGKGDYLGYDYLAQCDTSVAQTTNGDLHVAEGIRAVIRGELPEFSFDYPCHSPTEQRWFSARVAHFHHQDPHVVVAHLNVTGLQKIVLERESQQRKLQRMQRLYAALTEADHLIANSSDLNTLFTDICRFAVDLGRHGLDRTATAECQLHHGNERTRIKRGDTQRYATQCAIVGTVASLDTADKAAVRRHLF